MEKLVYIYLGKNFLKIFYKNLEPIRKKNWNLILYIFNLPIFIYIKIDIDFTFLKKKFFILLFILSKMTTKNRIILENEQVEELVLNKPVEEMTTEERRIADEYVEAMLEDVEEFIDSYLNH